MDVKRITERVAEKSRFAESLLAQVGKVIIGQRYMVERLLIGILSDGHILVEGVPGLAKTTAVRAFAGAMDLSFGRLQFTPDLLPADLTGTPIYNQETGRFTTKKGPIFANVILADEVNRAPAKVQSALLEAMQERQVTIGEETFPLPSPFLVMATQNPIEQEGTYPLPEAQVDRFMLKLSVGYPSKEEERRIIELNTGSVYPSIEPVVSASDIDQAREVVDEIYIDEKLTDYIVDLVFASREPDEYGLDIGALIEYGASPRASIYLAKTAKAHAFVSGRGYVTPQDIKSVAMDVLRHRVIISYEAEAENLTSVDVVQRILDHVSVP